MGDDNNSNVETKGDKRSLEGDDEIPAKKSRNDMPPSSEEHLLNTDYTISFPPSSSTESLTATINGQITAASIRSFRILPKKPNFLTFTTKKEKPVQFVSVIEDISDDDSEEDICKDSEDEDLTDVNAVALNSNLGKITTETDV